jgi:hypothetical protein
MYYVIEFNALKEFLNLLSSLKNIILVSKFEEN